MPEFDLFSSPGFLFINTAFLAKQNLTARFQKSGFDATVDQFAVLSVLNHEDGITQTVLCERSCKNSSNLTRILNGMTAKGLVERKAGEDARSRKVSMTENGKALYQALAPIAHQYMMEIFAPLTEEEQQALLSMLKRMKNRL